MQAEETGSPKTCVVHVRKHPFDTYIGRPSRFGNPYKIGRDGTRAEVIEKYRSYAKTNPEIIDKLETLRGKRLACWCVTDPVDYIRTDKQCHGEVLLELLEGT